MAGEQKRGDSDHELHMPSLKAILDLAREVRQPFTVAISAGGIGVALLGLAYRHRGDGYRLAFNTAVSFIGALDAATYGETGNEFKFPLPDLPGTTRFSNSVVRELTKQGEAFELINSWFYGLPILKVYEAPSIQDGFHLQEIGSKKGVQIRKGEEIEFTEE